MDKVTEAMSADIFVVEVGEKTAMRRRLLIAHQFVRQLDQNISVAVESEIYKCRCRAG